MRSFGRCQGVCSVSAFSARQIQLREQRSLSQKEVADACGVVVRAYQRYEYGEREPQLSTLIRLADFYQVALDDLVGREAPGAVPLRKD